MLRHFPPLPDATVPSHPACPPGRQGGGPERLLWGQASKGEQPYLLVFPQLLESGGGGGAAAGSSPVAGSGGAENLTAGPSQGLAVSQASLQGLLPLLGKGEWPCEAPALGGQRRLRSRGPLGQDLMLGPSLQSGAGLYPRQSPGCGSYVVMQSCQTCHWGAGESGILVLHPKVRSWFYRFCAGVGERTAQARGPPVQPRGLRGCWVSEGRHGTPRALSGTRSSHTLLLLQQNLSSHCMGTMNTINGLY